MLAQCASRQHTEKLIGVAMSMRFRGTHIALVAEGQPRQQLLHVALDLQMKRQQA
jgi:methyl coenzyme M reductase subunit C-like uncharacterized protein (methanogenesis marker protein 7)